MVSVATLLLTQVAFSQNSQLPDLKPLQPKLRALVVKYYPKASIKAAGDAITFSYKSRKFMMHEPTKKGDWQEAREEEGPDRGGVIGEIELRDGKYNGQAVTPQSFDKRYFVELVMSPYSEKLDSHLYIHLKFPRDASPSFLKEFQSLMNGFEKHLSPKKAGR